MVGFGWTVRQGRAVFHPGLEFGAAGEPVGAGPGGRVVAIRRAAHGTIVTLRVGPNLRLRLGPLARAGVRRGERVTRGARIGRAGPVPLRVEITVRGFPVDPIGPGQFAPLGRTR